MLLMTETAIAAVLRSKEQMRVDERINRPAPAPRRVARRSARQVPRPLAAET